MTQTQEFFSKQIDSSTASSQDITYEDWFRRKVEAGLRDARECRDISDGEMEAKTEALCDELIFKSSMS